MLYDPFAFTWYASVAWNTFGGHYQVNSLVPTSFFGRVPWACCYPPLVYTFGLSLRGKLCIKNPADPSFGQGKQAFWVLRYAKQIAAFGFHIFYSAAPSFGQGTEGYAWKIQLGKPFGFYATLKKSVQSGLA